MTPPPRDEPMPLHSAASGTRPAPAALTHRPASSEVAKRSRSVVVDAEFRRRPIDRKLFAGPCLDGALLSKHLLRLFA